MMNMLVQSQFQSQAFFFISSVGFIILGVLAAIFLIYLIRAMNTFSNVMDRVEKDIDNIGDTTEELLEEVRDSAIFNFLFQKKKRRNKSAKS